MKKALTLLLTIIISSNLCMSQFVIFTVIKKDMHVSVLPFYLSNINDTIVELYNGDFKDTLIAKFGNPILANEDYDFLIEEADSLDFKGTDIINFCNLYEHMFTEKNLRVYCEQNNGYYFGAKYEYLIFKATATYIEGNLRIRYWNYVPLIKKAKLLNSIQLSPDKPSKIEIDKLIQRIKK